ncbi:MAG: hypothetical protein NZM31_07475 [Gemmatales bacterium]|nr:hypothetical protein [Gemmatales bacterium]MDW8386835.1 hypothetical protein [Gemmatales bacterium]
MVRTLLTWTADVSLVLGIALLALSVLLVPEVVVFAEDWNPIEIFSCFFCNEDNCQARYSEPNCAQGTCSGWLCSSSCRCRPYGDGYYCDCQL